LHSPDAGAATIVSSKHTASPNSINGKQFWQYPLRPKSKLQNVPTIAQSSLATHIALSSATKFRLTQEPERCEYAHPRCVPHSVGKLIVSH
jgi:hypothetical protein|tara:strand:+ start:1164 stop:1436 length:273 start_codon:yes stop_codon:yes gene_type:complete